MESLWKLRPLKAWAGQAQPWTEDAVLEVKQDALGNLPIPDSGMKC